jgi:predicted RNase H-like HicB family nuclease
MSEKFRIDEYPFMIRRLTEDEGSGFLIEFPDLPGCVSDGETPEGAIASGRDAVPTPGCPSRRPEPGPQ